MKRESNVTVEQFNLPGLSETQLENPRSELKERRTPSPADNISLPMTQATCRRVVTKTKNTTNNNNNNNTDTLLTASKVSEPTGQHLTEKESRALVEQNLHFLGYRNVVAIGVRRKKIKGVEKVTQALVFKVKKKKSIEKISKSKIIPQFVTFRKDSGETQQIITDVVQVAGRPAHQVMSGDAVYERDMQTTVAGIVPYQIQNEPGKKPVKRLLTSAHLIHYDESRKGEMLHHPDETTPFCPITGFHPVTKYRRQFEPEEMKDASYNRLDILWADVNDSVAPSANIKGIRKPEVDEKFQMTGSSSDVPLSGTVKSTSGAIISHGNDSNGKYYTYWRDKIEYEVPAQEGDSGAGLIAKNDEKLIGLHSFKCCDISGSDTCDTDSEDNDSVNIETGCYACHLN